LTDVLRSLCRGALEKVVGTTDDKAVLGLLDNITNLKVQPLSA